MGQDKGQIRCKAALGAEANPCESENNRGGDFRSDGAHHRYQQYISGKWLGRRNCKSWVAAPFHNSTLLSLSAFVITDTELNVIAALAIIGLRSTPKKGYNTPAAIGIPTTL